MPPEIHLRFSVETSQGIKAYRNARHIHVPAVCEIVQNQMVVVDAHVTVSPQQTYGVVGKGWTGCWHQWNENRIFKIEIRRRMEKKKKKKRKKHFSTNVCLCVDVWNPTPWLWGSFDIIFFFCCERILLQCKRHTHKKKECFVVTLFNWISN